MKTCLMIIGLALSCCVAVATQVEPKELKDLVAESDHILIGRVVKVDMIDRDGKELSNPEARTGPGLANTIRLHVLVQTNEVLKTNAKTVPEKLVISEWQMWHFTLDSFKGMAGRTFIFLLKGDKYQWVYPAEYRQDLSKRSEVEKLIHGGGAPNKSVEPTRAPEGARGSP